MIFRQIATPTPVHLPAQFLMSAQDFRYLKDKKPPERGRAATAS